MKKKYYSLVRRAKQKKLQLDITFCDFKYLKLGDCHYCGVSELFLKYYCEVMKINTPWISVDRKNNNKGYLKTNCVSACFLCNKIKGSFFTYEEMCEIGKKYVSPKLKAYEDEAMDAYSDWCEKNIFLSEDGEDWDLTADFKYLKGD